MTNEIAQRSDDERMMAGLAHASILLGLLTSGLGGPIAALVIWLMKRDDSAWVGFQALQALIYQFLGIVVAFLSIMCWFVIWFGSLIPVMVNPDQYPDAPPPAFFVSFALLCVPFAISILWTLYGLWGALRAWQGEDFRYVVLGNALARRTGATST
ncbi:MAG: DUF4870 domain-containing protein [Anaerolineae bacterium]